MAARVCGKCGFKVVGQNFSFCIECGHPYVAASCTPTVTVAAGATAGRGGLNKAEIRKSLPVQFGDTHKAAPPAAGRSQWPPTAATKSPLPKAHCAVPKSPSPPLAETQPRGPAAQPALQHIAPKWKQKEQETHAHTASTPTSATLTPKEPAAVHPAQQPVPKWKQKEQEAHGHSDTPPSYSPPIPKEPAATQLPKWKQKLQEAHTPPENLSSPKDSAAAQLPKWKQQLQKQTTAQAQPPTPTQSHAVQHSPPHQSPSPIQPKEKPQIVQPQAAHQPPSLQHVPKWKQQQQQQQATSSSTPASLTAETSSSQVVATALKSSNHSHLESPRPPTPTQQTSAATVDPSRKASVPAAPVTKKGDRHTTMVSHVTAKDLKVNTLTPTTVTWDQVISSSPTPSPASSPPVQPTPVSSTSPKPDSASTEQQGKVSDLWQRLRGGLTTSSSGSSLSLEQQVIREKKFRKALLDTKDIELFEPPIGEGGSGVVYRGKCKRQEVAVKQMKYVELMEQSQRDEFVREVVVLKQIKDPHIVKFVGVVLSEDKLWHVTEFIAGGTLRDLVHKQQLSFPLKVKIALDIAKGMHALHQAKIIHRDLKTENCLVVSPTLDAPTTVKLTDFGASRKISSGAQKAYTKGIGTPIYMAPELLKCEEYNEKADVYSFAVSCWELLTQTEPYSEFPNPWAIASFVSDGSRLAIPAGTPKEFADVIVECWAQQASDRPAFSKVVSALQQIMKTLPCK
eukprot:TRINITY_DN796_c0_g1_i5.p1 TRINITY_DN796_c0_g1~~TRINITY_DN796_c0_g1_i5.p1  ORF type:complete len:736 (-),score=177.81 TRINITY_DN796_c0_g1_i5:104-2311(-)